MSRIIIVIIFIAVFILGAGFSAINTTPVAINFYLGSVTLPLAVLIVLAILVGAALSATALSISVLRLRYENSRLSKKLSVSEQEINSLRILPVKDSH
jgi:lipopolysaccharide assembly protein A